MTIAAANAVEHLSQQYVGQRQVAYNAALAARATLNSLADTRRG